MVIFQCYADVYLMGLFFFYHPQSHDQQMPRSQVSWLRRKEAFWKDGLNVTTQNTNA